MNIKKIYEEGARLVGERKYEEAALVYLPAAEKGDAKAQYELGQSLFYFTDEEDEEYILPQSVDWYLKAAGQGYLPAMHKLGRCYQYEVGVDEDYEKSLYWHTEAAKRGHADSQYELYEFYSQGEIVAKDEKEAFKWLRKAAKNRNRRSFHVYQLAYAYHWGKCCRKNGRKALELYKEAAEFNDDSAGRYIGDVARCYYRGTGTDVDYAKALELFIRSAGMGDFYSASWVGMMYIYGEGTEKNIGEGLRWYREAAEHCCFIQKELGDYFRYGYGDVPIDYEEAVKWYTKSCSEENEEALYELGTCYLCGYGVEVNERKAVRLYKRAAVWHHAAATRMVGKCYEFGWGIRKNRKLAAQWYEKARELGCEI